MGEYLAAGAALKRELLAHLPPDWSWDGSRVLDFGCGAGRVLRHLLDEAQEAEIWGCDRDEPSIDWLNRHMSPPLQAVAVQEEPKLPFPDAHFDLVWALSVFTHITANWSGWLLEVHRVLAPGGALVTTFLGAPMLKDETGEDWDVERIGMNVRLPGRPLDDGGPLVFHSRWWVEAHWGRAFEVVRFQERSEGHGHDWALLRKRDVELTPQELERVDTSEPGEVTALLHNMRQGIEDNVALSREVEALRWGVERGEEARADLQDELAVQRTRAAALEAEVAAREATAGHVAHQLAAVHGSRSWRLTAPLRWARAVARRGGSGAA
jgi:SAM-dependent methyltransferase